MYRLPFSSAFIGPFFHLYTCEVSFFVFFYSSFVCVFALMYPYLGACFGFKQNVMLV